MKAETVKIRKVFFEDEYIVFQYFNSDVLNKEIKLGIDYKFISDRFFSKQIPSEAETEYAINFIEDELMSNKELINDNEKLIISDSYVNEILSKNKLNTQSILRDEIESLFSDYARIIMGYPIYNSDFEFLKTDFAIILILREIVHHLDFENVYIKF